MECFFTDHGGRFSFEESVRLVVNLQSSVKKYLSKNEAVMLACLLSGVQSRERLMSAIWFDRGVVVTNASYYQLIAQLRKSFEEVGLPKDAIKTIPRFGLELDVRRGAADNGASSSGDMREQVLPFEAVTAPQQGASALVQVEAEAEVEGEVEAKDDAPSPNRSVADVLPVPSAGRGLFTFLRGCCRALMQEAGLRPR